MLKALIFDMDGTLVHSDPVHLLAFAEVLGPEGVVIDDVVFRNSIIGHTNESIFATLLPDHSVSEHEEFARRKEAAFRRLATDLKPLDGLGKLLDWADERDIRIALVTNAPILNATHMLDIIGVTKRFAVTVTIEDVARGKPDPLPYLTALERLGIGAGEAVAFEDSPSGMKAAKGAGLYSFGMLTGLTAEDMTSVGADCTITDFHDQGLWDFLEKRLHA
ncbi:HAD family hydrolase [Microvirga puerhi]|uniref:HAD family phosphatase n=1 Tax=Microvirga puerhi TaxID=2876078 RepID=A0ABS7VSV5_9HYPH|nr:HAD family phosphatase [Microvirga puerhi]MBZ6078636.1 HAD family phosphatase [Microvirga puerhi]